MAVPSLTKFWYYVLKKYARHKNIPKNLPDYSKKLLHQNFHEIVKEASRI